MLRGRTEGYEMSYPNLEVAQETFDDKPLSWYTQVFAFLEAKGYTPALFDELMKRPQVAVLGVGALEKLIEDDKYVMLDAIVLISDEDNAVVATLNNGVQLRMGRWRRIEDGGWLVQITEYPKMKTRPFKVPPVGWVPVGYGVELSLDSGTVFLARQLRTFSRAPQPA